MVVMEATVQPPQNATWQVHIDRSMWVAGVRGLMLQALHPIAMRGVWQNSTFQVDPIGRLQRTADFVSVVTWGSAEEADQLGRRVRGIHRALRVKDPDTGRVHRVDDPELLLWVHCAEVASYLEVTRRAGTWQAQLSELDELFGRSSDQVMRAQNQLSAVPIYVITASASANNTPSFGLDGKTQLEILHLQMAQASRNGSQRTVSSSHLVMIDRPDVVIAAVSEMIDAARAHREPAPLPPGENPVLPETDILKELFANPRGLLAPPDPSPPSLSEQN